MPKIYSSTQRAEIMQSLLDNGLILIKKSQMKKLNIETLTKMVGIGKGTFYNFFDSKELLVYAIVESQRSSYQNWIEDIIKEKGSLTRSDAKLFYTTFFFDKDNIYFYLNTEDIKAIHAKFSTSQLENFKAEQAYAIQFLDLISDKRIDYNLPAALNWIKIITFTIMNRHLLFEQAFENNILQMIDNLLNEIFEGKRLNDEI